MRSGRKVKEGCQPLKMVKQRAVTVHRRRAMEMAQQDGEEVMQGLYSESQTEVFVPDPVVNVSLLPRCCRGGALVLTLLACLGRSAEERFREY